MYLEPAGVAYKGQTRVRGNVMMPKGGWPSSRSEAPEKEGDREQDSEHTDNQSGAFALEQSSVDEGSHINSYSPSHSHSQSHNYTKKSPIQDQPGSSEVRFDHNIQEGGYAEWEISLAADEKSERGLGIRSSSRVQNAIAKVEALISGNEDNRSTNLSAMGGDSVFNAQQQEQSEQQEQGHPLECEFVENAPTPGHQHNLHPLYGHPHLVHAYSQPLLGSQPHVAAPQFSQLLHPHTSVSDFHYQGHPAGVSGFSSSGSTIYNNASSVFAVDPEIMSTLYPSSLDFRISRHLESVLIPKHSLVLDEHSSLVRFRVLEELERIVKAWISHIYLYLYEGAVTEEALEAKLKEIQKGSYVFTKHAQDSSTEEQTGVNVQPLVQSQDSSQQQPQQQRQDQQEERENKEGKPRQAQGQGSDVPAVDLSCGARVMTCGSYRMGVSSPTSDVDAVFMVPRFVDRYINVFGLSQGVNRPLPPRKCSLIHLLEDLEYTENIVAVPEAFVPVIKFHLYGVEVDLLVACLPMDSIPPALDILDDGILKNVDDATQRSINGVRVTLMIMKIVPNVEHFRTVLRVVKCWAKRRCIYSNAMGFLGGISWAILVAKICLLFPNASPNTLLEQFFQVYGNWNWPTPVSLCLPAGSGNPELGLKVWNPVVNRLERKHLMPIITPAYPSLNSSYNVSQTTFRIIHEELSRACAAFEPVFHMRLNLINREEDGSGFAPPGNTSSATATKTASAKASSEKVELPRPAEDLSQQATALDKHASPNGSDDSLSNTLSAKKVQTHAARDDYWITSKQNEEQAGGQAALYGLSVEAGGQAGGQAGQMLQHTPIGASGMGTVHSHIPVAPGMVPTYPVDENTAMPHLGSGGINPSAPVFSPALTLSEVVLDPLATWNSVLDELLQPSDFFLRHPAFLVIEVFSQDPEDQNRWCAFVEAKLRYLILRLEVLLHTRIRPLPMTFSQNPLFPPGCTNTFLFGITFDIHAAVLDYNMIDMGAPIREWYNQILGWIDRKETMLMNILQVQGSDIPEYIYSEFYLEMGFLPDNSPGLYRGSGLLSPSVGVLDTPSATPPPPAVLVPIPTNVAATGLPGGVVDMNPPLRHAQVLAELGDRVPPVSVTPSVGTLTYTSGSLPPSSAAVAGASSAPSANTSNGPNQHGTSHKSKRKNGNHNSHSVANVTGNGSSNHGNGGSHQGHNHGNHNRKHSNHHGMTSPSMSPKISSKDAANQGFSNEMQKLSLDSNTLTAAVGGGKHVENGREHVSKVQDDLSSSGKSKGHGHEHSRSARSTPMSSPKRVPIHGNAAALFNTSKKSFTLSNDEQTSKSKAGEPAWGDEAGLKKVKTAPSKPKNAETPTSGKTATSVNDGSNGGGGPSEVPASAGVAENGPVLRGKAMTNGSQASSGNRNNVPDRSRSLSSSDIRVPEADVSISPSRRAPAGTSAATVPASTTPGTAWKDKVKNGLSVQVVADKARLSNANTPRQNGQMTPK